jgi:protein-disulfide isomerase
MRRRPVPARNGPAVRPVHTGTEAYAHAAAGEVPVVSDRDAAELSLSARADRTAVRSGARAVSRAAAGITRRDLMRAAAALALGGALAATSTARIAPILSARAQPGAVDALMQPGPLPDRMLGSSQARVTIIEYASLTCAHCARFAATTFPELKARYIDSGKVRYILREYPIDPLAVVAALLPRCVGEDDYFATVETLLRRQPQWVGNRIEPLMTLATTELGFTEQSLAACMADRQLREDIKKATDRASNVLGVNAVPTFFINGRKHTGAMSIKDLERLIGPLLRP